MRKKHCNCTPRLFAIILGVIVLNVLGWILIGFINFSKPTLYINHLVFSKTSNNFTVNATLKNDNLYALSLKTLSLTLINANTLPKVFGDISFEPSTFTLKGRASTNVLIPAELSSLPGSAQIMGDIFKTCSRNPDDESTFKGGYRGKITLTAFFFQYQYSITSDISGGCRMEQGADEEEK